jgi:squalene synthase HpnC
MIGPANSANSKPVELIAKLPPPGGLPLPADGCSLAEAEGYCQRLAAVHYENFSVASWLAPPPLRRHFFNVYAYCRWADDLADEAGEPAAALALLDWWGDELDRCYAGVASHPVFIALRGTALEFAIPQQVFADLLVAFRQDQTVSRYATVEDLLGYCHNSANPVGRLVLYLGRCHNESLGALSDRICTGLQLINFCQDVAADWDRGRVYLPQASWAAAGYTPEMFARREFNPAFRDALRGEVDRAEGLLNAGRPLVAAVAPELRFDVALFLLGGLAAVAAVRAAGYNVWHGRPRVGKWTKLRLFPQAWLLARRGAFNADRPHTIDSQLSNERA